MSVAEGVPGVARSCSAAATSGGGVCRRRWGVCSPPAFMRGQVTVWVTLRAARSPWHPKPCVGLLAGGSRVNRALSWGGNGVGRGHRVPHPVAPMCPVLHGEERLRVRPASCSASCFGLLGACRGRENFIMCDKPFFPRPGEVSGLAVTAAGGEEDAWPGAGPVCEG